MRIVLDTHTLIYASVGNLSAARKEFLDDHTNELLFSAFSLWEIAKLYELKRIQPIGGLQSYLNQLVHHPRYELIQLLPEILVKMTEISRHMHKDPADQIIVATALVRDAKLMTDDKQIKTSGLVAVL